MDFHNQLTSLAVLIFILSTCLGTSLAKQHPVRHAHSRHKRQYGHPSDFVPDSYIVDGPGGPEYGNWGPWSGPSECSRTCGGGVAYQTRHCQDVSPDGRPLCHGGSKRYFSCNIQECHGDPDYRSEQCAEYNRVPFEDRYYDWIPYTKAPNLCELNCMPRGERFYYRHNKKVVDGTRCDDEKLDVCVDGQCLPVGCDRLLGSSAREDNCRECGGDGSSCTTVQGILDNNDLQVGYNDILLIPAGATNIKVKEIQPTNNYLAVRNTTGHYYLNGNWRIDFPRKLRFVGTVFHYERKPHGFYAPESISALGPTFEPIYISLLYQEPNPGVMYEYSIPKGISPHSLTDNYTWVESEFGPCSMTCGGGTQQRSVTCVRRRDMIQVPENLCNANYMPTSIQSCSSDPCPPAWNTGPWSQCSESCERGMQERQVYCMQIVANGLPSVADERECEHTGEKPPNKQECNVDVICPTWHVGPWKRCNKLCGEGRETRDVICYRRTDGKIEVLDDYACQEKKPESEKPCLLRPCEGVDWIASEWSGCDEKCGLTQETRTAHCVTQTGVVYADSFCHKYRKPELVRKCETVKKCDHEWYATQWSECSSKCAAGVQTRKVFCGEIDDEGLIKKVEDDKCDPAEKYESKKECVGEEECKGDWFAGPWSTCSKECGGGQKTRKILCVQDNNTVPISNCDGNSVPFSSESCNNHACGEDEIYTVEPTHDLSEDDEEECEYDDDYDEDYDEEGQTRPMDSTSEAISTSGLSTALSNTSEYSTQFSELTSISPISTDLSSESDMSSLSTSFILSSSFEPSTTGLSTSEISTESAISTESSSAISLSSFGTETSLSSSSMSTDCTGGGSSTDCSISSSVETSSTDIISSSSDFTSESPNTSEMSMHSSDSSSSESAESTEVSESSSLESSDTTIDSTENSQATTSSEIPSTESTKTVELSSSEPSVSTELLSSSESSEKTESFSVTSTENMETTYFTATDSSHATETTDFTESSDSSYSTESTDYTSTEGTDTSQSTSSTKTMESSESTASSDISLSSSSSSETFASTTVTITSTSEGSSSGSSFLTTALRGIGEVDDLASSLSTETTDISTQSTNLSDASTESTDSSEGTTESTDSSGGSTENTDTSESTSQSIETSESSTESTETSESSTSISTETSGITTSSTFESTENTESSESTCSGASTETSTSVSTDNSGSTESTDSSASDRISSADYTGSTESTASSMDGSESTKTAESSSEISSESDFTGSTEVSQKWSTTGIDELYGSSMYSIRMAITKELKLKKCKPKKKPKCRKSEFGCCPDGKTPAEGPFGKGCPQAETCEESEFGCCPDGVSPAKGKNKKGCPQFDCKKTLYGCCPDKVSVAFGNDYEGCPEEMLPAECSKSQFGCCPDNMTSANGPNYKGCFTCEGSGECDSCNVTVFGCCPNGLRAATGPNYEGCAEGSGDVMECANTTYGCCPDGIISAEGPNFENCGIIDSDNCSLSHFGCCPDGITPALGSRYEGCKMPCESTQYGCCEDNFTPAHGPNREGCCLNSPFGCCPDNILYARGPNFQDCGCQYSPYGCCPDNQTAARGYNNEGCGCQYTTHGCCPDNYTPAPAPGYQGCPCYTFQFGCCPDGVTVAKGPQRLGCGCENTEFGCCSDGKTPASGPEKAGCGCEASQFGCCPDGVEEALGEDFDGCKKQLEIPGEVCKLPKDRGSCRDFTVKWFYDMQYGGCTRFWYGGCEGNENKFKTQEECNAVCVAPEGKDRCFLPKVEGPCEKYFPKWYYDNERKQCGQFIYGGCLGNSNNFDTREECQELCSPEQAVDPCDQPVEEGPCEGNFIRWHYDKDRKSCLQFRYGGCKANANNFLTESACKEQCLQPGRSRVAEICQLNKDPGPCRGSVLRWYYDDKFGTCRQFFYGGCLGNNNRFKSETECKHKCRIFDSNRDHCSLPREPGTCNEKIPRWYFDNSENRCMPFYYTGCEGNANRFETREECETDCPPRIYKDLCHLPALIGECYNYTERWYYDAQARRCSPFYYGGCGGNQNNFEQQIDCQKRCEAYVAEERIDLATRRPATPEPEHFRIEYCFYGSDPGSCRPDEFLPKWFYDRADGVCKQFLYGGCDGNGNRFNSREECEHYCGNAQDICSLPKTVGPCSGSYPQWYYDRQTDTCNEFDYGGCQGNGNRFNTRYDCEIRCRHGAVEPPTIPPTAIVPTHPPQTQYDSADICYVKVDPGPCLGEHPSWYYDVHTRRCQAFVYGGCFGNANRFDSEEQCERQCGQFRDQDICNQPYDPGSCSGQFQKYFYDVENRICREYTYSGCGGNSNRFSSLRECETLCIHREEALPVTNDTTLPHQAICRLPVEVGPCRDAQYKRWYYEESERTCVAFVYSGCGGNFNRFKNFDTCIKFCVAQIRDVEPPPQIEDPNEIIVQVPDYCNEERRKCGQLHCPYGLEKFVDSQDCERCRCNNPCREHYCPEGTRCAVDLYHDETGRISVRGICREENKAGQCPSLANDSGSCTPECQSDADCPGPLKCCTANCANIPMTSCVHPVESVVSETTSPPVYHRPFYGSQPPVIVADETYVVAPEGSYATLKCIVRGFPTPVVSWRKDSTVIDGSGGRHKFLVDGSLQIIGLHGSDAGVYYCAANNGVGNSVQKEFTLEVTDPTPRPAEVIGDENNYVVVTLGTPVILQCYAIGWPRPGVTWWRGDRMLPLSSGQYEQRRDFSLLIKSLTLRNLGSYVCQAYNGLGKAASGTVTIQAIGPVYSSNPEDEPYLKYLVDTPQKPEGPSRYWLTYRPQLTYTPSYDTTNKPKPQTYSPSPHGDTPTQQTPRVFLVPLAVNVSLDQTNFPVGSDISIPCLVDGYPIPRVTWYKDNEIVQPSRKIEITESNRLKIIRADGSDSGLYRCLAQNQYEEVSSHVNITVEGVYIHPNCTDNIFFANCELIVKARHCQHKYYARFCCKSCTKAGQLPSHGPHLDDIKSTTSSN